MVLKLVLLLISLLLLIFGIYKACDLEYDFDRYAEEYVTMCVIGGIVWVVGVVTATVNSFCGCGGSGLKIGATLIVAGMTMFAEPFIHYLISKNC